MTLETWSPAKKVCHTHLLLWVKHTAPIKTHHHLIEVKGVVTHYDRAACQEMAHCLRMIRHPWWWLHQSVHIDKCEHNTSGRTNFLKPTCHLGHHKLRSSEEVVMDAGESLRMLEPDCNLDRIFKIWPRWGKCINVLGDCVRNNGTSAK
jgi:hypothetical protein